MAGVFVWRQRLFLAEAAEGGVGPAVIGLIAPRIILPKDFEARFAPEEQHIVLAHETVHLKAHDARVNALVALAQCVSWFNPLVHIAAFTLRTDQELACDAVVLARHPSLRKTYAEALVKTQLAATPLPIGCYWPARSEHPLTERIAMMKLPVPTKAQRYAGGAAVALLSLSAGVAAWAAQPARTVITPAAAAAATPTAGAVAQLSTPAPTSTGADAQTSADAAVERSRVRAERLARALAAGDGAFDRRLEVQSEAIERALEQVRAPGERGRLTEDQSKRVAEALARAQADMAGARQQIRAFNPQVELALAQARTALGATEAAQSQAAEQALGRLRAAQAARPQAAEPLSPADEAALAQSRADLQKAREDLRQAQKDMAEAHAAMARAQAALITQQMRRTCIADRGASGPLCKGLGAPGALLELPGSGVDGAPLKFGFLGRKGQDGPLVFELKDKALRLPGRRLDCDRQPDGGLIRCKSAPGATATPAP